MQRRPVRDRAQDDRMSHDAPNGARRTDQSTSVQRTHRQFVVHQSTLHQSTLHQSTLHQ
jgi:hypothetical protein